MTYKLAEQKLAIQQQSIGKKQHQIIRSTTHQPKRGKKKLQPSVATHKKPAPLNTAVTNNCSQTNLLIYYKCLSKMGTQKILYGGYCIKRTMRKQKRKITLTSTTVFISHTIPELEDLSKSSKKSST